MEKERIENVLKVDLTKDDMKYIRTYYLKFYNDPEKFEGSGVAKAVLEDLGKTPSYSWVNKQVVPEDVKFEECSFDDEHEIFLWEGREEFNSFGDQKSTLSEMLRRAFSSSYKLHDSKLLQVDIDVVLSIMSRGYRSYGQHAPKDTMLTDIKRAWLEIVKDYTDLNIATEEDALRQAVGELARQIEGFDTSGIDVMARMVRAYEFYTKCVTMVFRCSEGRYIQRDLITEFIKGHISGGSSEVMKMVGDINATFDWTHDCIPGSVTCASMHDVCTKVLSNHIGFANFGGRALIKSGKCATIEEANSVAVGLAAERAEALNKEDTMYIEDVDTALLQMKMLMDSIRDWNRSQPWFKHYPDYVIDNDEIDWDLVWSTANNKLSGWDIFAHYVYGFNAYWRTFVSHREYDGDYSVPLNHSELLYKDLRAEGEAYLKTAVHRKSSGISALLKMAEGNKISM